MGLLLPGPYTAANGNTYSVQHNAAKCRVSAGGKERRWVQIDAWVVGGTSGIGAQVVERLRARGLQPLAFSNDEKAGGHLRDRGLEFAYLDLGLSGEAVVERTETLLRQYDPPTYLFMSAGLTRQQAAVETSVAEWELLANVNLLGVVHVCNAVARSWRLTPADPWIRHCVIVGSVNAFRPLSSQGAYSVMKAGLHAYAKCLSNDLAEDQIRVNVIAPGAIWTPMNEALWLDDRDSIAKQKVLKSSLLGRWGEPQEIADVAVWLALDSPTFVSGTELVVDGGHLAQR